MGRAPWRGLHTRRRLKDGGTSVRGGRDHEKAGFVSRVHGVCDHQCRRHSHPKLPGPQGETDWKVLVVDVDSPEMTSNPNAQLADLKKPEELTEIIEWFRNYKTAEGKGLNKFGLDEKIIGPEESFRVVMDTHKFWKGLMQKKTKEGEL